MPLDDLLADGKTYACPLVFPFSMQSGEDAEDLFLILWFYADAVVLDGEDIGVTLPLCRYADFRLTLSILDAVAYEILKKTAKLTESPFTTGRSSL
jgi:hypothetical protein